MPRSSIPHTFEDRLEAERARIREAGCAPSGWSKQGLAAPKDQAAGNRRPNQQVAFCVGSSTTTSPSRGAEVRRENEDPLEFKFLVGLALLTFGCFVVLAFQ